MVICPSQWSPRLQGMEREFLYTHHEDEYDVELSFEEAFYPDFVDSLWINIPDQDSADQCDAFVNVCRLRLTGK